MATFYSFKNKYNEPLPLIKLPGSIEGQMFDIADCENCTLVVLDHSEQVQIDNLKNCKVFIAACASSIFVRNCTDCTFYTCCRQLRLREVTNTTFYVYSMSEVHIEYSSKLKFAPFNGGYPQHSAHLIAANINSRVNLWYDIYDHNDSEKSGANWSLLAEEDYEDPWFPMGEPCELAVARTLPQSTAEKNTTIKGATAGGMQSFSIQQMMNDAKSAEAVAVAVASNTPPTEPSAPVEDSAALMGNTEEARVVSVLTKFAELTVNSKDFEVCPLSVIITLSLTFMLFVETADL